MAWWLERLQWLLLQVLVTKVFLPNGGLCSVILDLQAHASKARPARAFLRFTSVKRKKGQTLKVCPFLFGAGEMNRTPDLLITNELLYRLSYTGLSPQL